MRPWRQIVTLLLAIPFITGICFSGCKQPSAGKAAGNSFEKGAGKGTEDRPSNWPKGPIRWKTDEIDAFLDGCYDGETAGMQIQYCHCVGDATFRMFEVSETLKDTDGFVQKLKDAGIVSWCNARANAGQKFEKPRTGSGISGGADESDTATGGDRGDCSKSKVSVTTGFSGWDPDCAEGTVDAGEVKSDLSGGKFRYTFYVTFYERDEVNDITADRSFTVAYAGDGPPASGRSFDLSQSAESGFAVARGKNIAVNAAGLDLDCPSFEGSVTYDEAPAKAGVPFKVSIDVLCDGVSQAKGTLSGIASSRQD